MFHVKIKLSESKIHGIGLFANEDISKGKIVYSINEKLDLLLTEKNFLKLLDDEKCTIKHYGYFDKNRKIWHLSFDDIRFCNHSVNGNITIEDNKLIAVRDIRKNKEITQNYGEFEELRKLKHSPK
ncbi:MAG: SET domain-containing protein [Candidatus Pacearchaeota archaeon]